MRNIHLYKGKKVTIIGLARSGLASANLLYKLGADVRVSDKKDDKGMRDQARQLSSKNIRLELGSHSREFVLGSDLVIVSPGVPNDALPVKWALEAKIRLISEIEFAWSLCPATVIAVTGSNGKTTTTTLIGRVLEAAGKKVFVCGNIGNPFSAAVEQMGEGDYAVLEVSSFQLERTESFRPKVAVILNFSPNHLDRHKDMQEYLEAKKRIFANQKGDDYTVLNAQDEVVRGFVSQTKARVAYFAGSSDINPNYAAVLAVGSVFGLKNEGMLRVLEDFNGIEHRMEHVGQIKGIKFINDSKATTVESTIWALANIRGPVLLIAGGRHKGIDYRKLLSACSDKVKRAILIGEAASIIKEALAGGLPIDEASSLEDAVRKAFAAACPGDTVLLSPMCSSYDMFCDYEERGRVFKKIVEQIGGESR